MAAQVVVGLFESSGIAEDACNRLRTAGFPPQCIHRQVLREIGPVPSTMEPELAALEVDPLVFGNVRERYAEFIHNGETLVVVRAANEAEAEAAFYALRQYAPLAVEVLEPLPPR